MTSAPPPWEQWLVGGEPVDPKVIVEVQSAWYAQRPDAVTAGLSRYSGELALLGLAGTD